MNTNEKELLDQYELCVDRLFSAVIEASNKGVAFLTAIGEGGSGVPEIQENFGWSSELRKLQLEKDASRKAFNESGPHEGRIAQRVEDLHKMDRLLDAAVAEVLIGPPVNVGIAGSFAFERDPSGRKIDQFLESLFGVNFAKKRIAVRGIEDPIGSARHIGHRVAFQFCSRDVFDRVEMLSGKGPAYFAQFLRNEQRRIIRDEEIEDRNHLGGTPKESRDLSDDDRELIREANRNAADIDDLTTVAAIYNSESPEEIALSREEEFSMESFLNRHEPELPDDQRLLFEAARAGESMSVARRRLGLRKSTETALRNRFKRWANEWRAQQAS